MLPVEIAYLPRQENNINNQLCAKMNENDAYVDSPILAAADTSINSTVDSSLLDLSNSSVNNSSIISEQEALYGHILPAPEKLHEPTSLPSLTTKLIIPKKRTKAKDREQEFEFDTPISNKEESSKKPCISPSTPGKSRNFSSPARTRIPSITESPIPKLSPNEGPMSSSNTPNVMTPLDMHRHNSPLALRNFSSPIVKPRRITPIQHRLNQVKNSNDEDGTENARLDKELRKLQNKIENLKRVQNYKTNNDEEKLRNLINKWSDIAEKASNYLLNEARLKINKIGGIEEYRKKQKKQKLKKLKYEFDQNLLYELLDYIESEEFENLDKYDKLEVLERKKEIEELSEKIENGDYGNEDENDENSYDDEFTMEELYKQLNLDYDLVFGRLTK